MRKGTSLLTLLLLLGYVSSATAAKTTVAKTKTMHIDTAHSNVGFEIRHLVSFLMGKFTQFEGSASFDDGNKLTAFEATIRMESVDTSIPFRDQHLRSSDFFHVDKFPTARFESKKILIKPPRMYHIIGDLTLKGVTKEVTMLAYDLETQVDQFGVAKRGFKLVANLNRLDFNVNYNLLGANQNLILGNRVKVVIYTQLH